MMFVHLTDGWAPNTRAIIVVVAPRRRARAAQVLSRQLDLCDEYLSLAAAYPPVGGGASGGHGTVKAHVFKILYRVLCREGMHDLRGR